MGTIADKLNYLNTTKGNIKNAIINKGVSVSDSDTFRSYADKIASIGADAYTIVDDTTPASLKTLTTAPYPMGACKVGIEAVQDLNGYSKPWAGGAGKNKFRTTATSKTESDVTWTVNSDGSITVSGTATGYTSIGVGEARVQSSMGNVTISGISGTTNLAWGGIDLRDENDNILYNITSGSTYESFTVDLSQYPSAYRISMTIKRNNNGAVSGTIKPQVELGQTVTTFEPYSNICPITGWDAVNLYKTNKNILPNKYYQVDSTTLALGTETADTFPVYLEANENYVLSFDTNKTAVVLSEKCEDETSATTHTYTNGMFNITSRNAGYYSFTLTNSSAITSSDFLNVMLEKGTTKTSYEAYNGQTYTIDLDGTRYGGTLDVVSGVLTLDRKYVDLGTLSWEYGATFYSELSDAKLSNLSPVNATAVSSKYFWSEKAINYGISSMEDKAFVIGNVYKYIYIKDLSYTDATTFKTAMSGVQLVYELATPIIIQLTPRVINTNSGTTNIWADSGDIEEVKYLTPLS